MKYLFVSENKIIPYNGEILKRVIDNKLVKAIANPRDEDLADFGYKELVVGVEPDYDAETQQLSVKYKLSEDGSHIETVYEVIDGVGIIDDVVDFG